MARIGYKAYVLAVTSLGLGITPQGIEWCWRFAILPEDVRGRILELTNLGFVRSSKAARELHDTRGMSASERQQIALDRILAKRREQG